MKINIKKINNFNSINEICKSDIKNNFFLNDEWLNIISEVFGLENIYLEIKYQNTVFYFFAQKRGNILFAPFIGYGGIINFSHLNDKEIKKIFSEIENFTNCKFKRTKFFPSLQNIKESIHHTVILNIFDNEVDQEKKYAKVIRNSINYAQKKGIKIRKIVNYETDSFYSIYLETMERVKSEYITPEILFEKIRNIEDVIFLGAYNDKEMIAGSIFMVSGDFMFYWWNASNIQGRNMCANYLLIDSAIKIAREKGIKFLDMASSNNKNIERGKLLWGGEKVPFIYLNFS